MQPIFAEHRRVRRPERVPSMPIMWICGSSQEAVGSTRDELYPAQAQQRTVNCRVGQGLPSSGGSGRSRRLTSQDQPTRMRIQSDALFIEACSRPRISRPRVQSGAVISQSQQTRQRFTELPSSELAQPIGLRWIRQQPPPQPLSLHRDISARADVRADSLTVCCRDCHGPPAETVRAQHHRSPPLSPARRRKNCS